MEKANKNMKIKSKTRVDTFVNMAKVLNGQKRFNSQPLLKELEEKQESFQKHKYEPIPLIF